MLDIIHPAGIHDILPYPSHISPASPKDFPIQKQLVLDMDHVVACLAQLDSGIVPGVLDENL